MALLRGIGPLNPNMRNEKLRQVFVDLGFENVRSVITTGNIIFDSPSSALRRFEALIEEALPRQLGFHSTTIVRGKSQIQHLLDNDTLQSLARAHGEDVDVTFLKRKQRVGPPLPYQPNDDSFTVTSLDDLTMASVLHGTGSRSPDYMRWIEQQFGKEMTTRTYRTVNRIMNKLRE